MTSKKMGKQTLKFPTRPAIIGTGSVVGEKEGKGPLAQWFDTVLTDDMYEEKSWEKAESKILKEAIQKAVDTAGVKLEDIDVLLSGDLLNQLMSSSFMARDMGVPFIGLYGACSTMTESLLLGSVLVDGRYASNVVAAASSHYCTAERQFRMPLEHGNQRPPSAQWTVTGAGGVVLAHANSKICTTYGTIGKVVDAGIKDPNLMGPAMAAAAADTLFTHLQDTGREPSYYDGIFTGDLGQIGKDMLIDMMLRKGYHIKDVYDDCGVMMFHPDQDTHSGGSGCGCSASIFAGRLYKGLQRGELKRILIMSTGAMLSTISPMQGESIPGIAHAVAVETE